MFIEWAIWQMRPEQFKAKRYSAFKSNYAPPASQFFSQGLSNCSKVDVCAYVIFQQGTRRGENRLPEVSFKSIG